VGDGPDWDQVHARAQAPNLANGVHLAGHRSDVATWYRAADLYVISSNTEGLSNTMIEALASGLPVVSTRVSGSSILVESPAAGLVVDVGDVESLAGTIEALLKDESRRRWLGENARLTFETRFSMETLIKTTILLYQELRDQKKKHRIA
jgi:glycosyltransferase involved in cell wall biosynthesis